MSLASGESFEDSEWHVFPYLNNLQTKQTVESFEDSKWYVVPYLNNLQTKQTAKQSTNKTNCGKL